MRRSGKGAKHRNGASVFRSFANGREAEIESSLVRALPGVIFGQKERFHVLLSMRVGAGYPDVLAVSHSPHLKRILGITKAESRIIATLRARKDAGLKSIRAALPNSSPKSIAESLKVLQRLRVVRKGDNGYSLTPLSRELLTRVVAIEVKVDDWRRGSIQAFRNFIFAHKSYVALPHAASLRAAKSAFVRKLGVGVLSVDNTGRLAIILDSKLKEPRIWHYYYEIAIALASAVGKSNNSIRRRSGRRAKNSA